MFIRPISLSTAFQAFLYWSLSLYLGILLSYKHWYFFTTSAEVLSPSIAFICFPRVHKLFSIFMNGVLKIFNILNKSSYLRQQHYLNHFHFT